MAGTRYDALTIDAIKEDSLKIKQLVSITLNNGEVFNLCSGPDALNVGSVDYSPIYHIDYINHPLDNTTIGEKSIDIAIMTFDSSFLETMSKRSNFHWLTQIVCSYIITDGRGSDAIPPVVFFRGRIIEVSQSVKKGKVGVKIKAINPMAIWNKENISRYSNSFQKSKYPDDNGFSLVLLKNRVENYEINNNNNNNLKAPTRNIVYGTTLVEGKSIYNNVKGGYYYSIKAMAGHICGGIPKVFVGGKEYSLSLPYSTYNDNDVYIATYNGTQAMADPVLVEDLAEWDSSFVLRDTCYVVTKTSVTGFGGTRPEISAIVIGKIVNNPISLVDSTSTNPALIIRDYLTSIDGYNLPEVYIDNDSFNKAIVDCEIEYTYIQKNEDGSDSQLKTKAFSYSKLIDTEDTRGDILSDIINHMGGWLKYDGSKFKIQVGNERDLNKAFLIEKTYLIDGYSISTLPNIDEYYNSIEGSFTDEKDLYNEISYGVLDIDDKSNADGLTYTLTKDFKGCNKEIDAYKLAYIHLSGLQQFKVVSFNVKIELAHLTAGDLIVFNLDNTATDSSYFIVESMRLDFKKGTIGILAKEFNNSVYNFKYGSKTIEFLQEIRPVVWTATKEIDALTSIESTYQDEYGNEKIKSVVSWQITDPDKIVSYFELSVGGSIVRDFIGSEDRTYEVEEIEKNYKGETTTFGIRSVSYFGRKSSWLYYVKEIPYNTTVPKPIADLSLVYGAVDSLVKWTSIENTDVAQFGKIECRYGYYSNNNEGDWIVNTLEVRSHILASINQIRVINGRGYFKFKVFDKYGAESTISVIQCPWHPIYQVRGLVHEKFPSIADGWGGIIEGNYRISDDEQRLESILTNTNVVDTKSDIYDVEDLYTLSSLHDLNIVDYNEGVSTDGTYTWLRTISTAEPKDRIVSPFLVVATSGVDRLVLNRDLFYLEYGARTSDDVDYSDWARLHPTSEIYYFKDMRFRAQFRPFEGQRIEIKVTRMGIIFDDF